MKFEQYEHHKKLVWTITELRGKHKEHCLCYSCVNFNPGLPEDNCPIANLLFAVCLECGITTPVYECPRFTEKDVK